MDKDNYEDGRRDDFDELYDQDGENQNEMLMEPNL